MKKIIGIGIAALMVLGLGVAAHADANNWVVYFSAKDSNGLNYLNASNLYGWKTSTTVSPVTDGVDGLKDGSDVENNTTNGLQVALGAFDIGVGSKGNGFARDFRPSNSSAFQSAWHLKLWVDTGFAGTAVKLSSWNPTGTNTGLVAGKKVSVKFNGKVLRTNSAGAIVEAGDASGKDWVFDGATFGTSAAPAYTWVIPVADFGAKGLNNALNLELSVPEPGSIVAMLSGLVGLAGFGIRRRK